MPSRIANQAAELAIQSMTRISSADTTSYRLRPDEVNVEVTTDATHALELFMPSVAECPGVTFTVFFKTDGGQDVTVKDSAGNQIGVPLVKAGDNQVLYSNGFRLSLILQVIVG